MRAMIKDAQAVGIIDPTLHPQQVIDFFIGSIQRAVIMWEYRKRRYQLTSQFEPLFKVLWNGIRGNEVSSAAIP
jgi:hypothetical protein